VRLRLLRRDRKRVRRLKAEAIAHGDHWNLF
jgi:hypothetical protein